MTKTTKWLLGGVAALAVSGLLYTMPALAAGKGNGFGYGMMQAFGGDMMAMHNTMAPLMGQMPAIHNEMMDGLADLLDLSADELNTALNSGKSLTQIAEEQGVAIGQVRAFMTQNMKDLLDRLVEAGSLTKAQAGQMLGYMEANLEACLSGQIGGMMSMMSGMMGR